MTKNEKNFLVKFKGLLKTNSIREAANIIELMHDLRRDSLNRGEDDFIDATDNLELDNFKEFCFKYCDCFYSSGGLEIDLRDWEEENNECLEYSQFGDIQVVNTKKIDICIAET
jgi:hypothetical protein